MKFTSHKQGSRKCPTTMRTPGKPCKTIPCFLDMFANLCFVCFSLSENQPQPSTTTVTTMATSSTVNQHKSSTAATTPVSQPVSLASVSTVGSNSKPLTTPTSTTTIKVEVQTGSTVGVGAAQATAAVAAPATMPVPAGPAAVPYHPASIVSPLVPGACTLGPAAVAMTSVPGSLIPVVAPASSTPYPTMANAAPTGPHACASTGGVGMGAYFATAPPTLVPSVPSFVPATPQMPRGPTTDWTIEDVIQFIAVQDPSLAIHAELFRKHVSIKPGARSGCFVVVSYF